MQIRIAQIRGLSTQFNSASYTFSETKTWRKTTLYKFAKFDTIFIILYSALEEWQNPNDQTRQKNGNCI